MDLSSALSKLKDAAKTAGSAIVDAMEYYPPVAFSFRVEFIDDKKKSHICYFQEVSGIEAKRDMMEVKEGGRNTQELQLPERVSYDPLVLKRGMQVKNNSNSSPIVDWCTSCMKFDFTEKIKTMDVQVQLLAPLLDTSKLSQSNGRTPLATWFFHKAYPSKWAIDALDADKDDILMEEIELRYQYFERKV